jgi:hypothetical protein
MLGGAISSSLSSMLSLRSPDSWSGRNPFRRRRVRSHQATTRDPQSVPAAVSHLRLPGRRFCALLIRPARLIRSAIVLKPSTLLSLHRTLRNRRYRMLFSPKRRRRPGPKGPSREVVEAVSKQNSAIPLGLSENGSADCLDFRPPNRQRRCPEGFSPVTMGRNQTPLVTLG